MLQRVPVVRETRELRRARTCTPKGKKLRHILPFELFLREIWPEDRTKNYMRLTGAKPRTAKNRVSGDYPPGGYEEIAEILRSEHGFKFLNHIMGDARPAWFAGIERARDIGALRRSLAEQQRKLAQFEMGV